MAWTLADLLDTAELSLVLRSGNKATPVRWTHVSDLPDPTPYLDRDWLLLTTGLTLTAEEDCTAYVQRLSRAGIAALGFGVGLVHPAVPDGLVAAAHRFGLPLIEVPEQTRFSDVLRVMIEDRVRADLQGRLRSVMDQQRQLIAAAEARLSRRAVVSLLARHLGAWAMVLTPDGRFLVGAPETAGHHAELVGMELRKGPAGLRAFEVAGKRVVLFPFGTTERSRAWLAVGRAEPLSVLESGLVETAITLLQLDSARSIELLDAERRERRIVLDLLLAGRELLAERASETLGLPFPDGDLRIALLEEAGDGTTLLGLLENDRSLQVVSALVAPEPHGRAAVVVPDVEGVLEVLQGVLSQVAGGRGVVSEPIEITGIPQAWRRLGTLINAVAAGASTRLAVAGDVAAEGLLAHLDTADVRGWADALLSPLEPSGRIDLIGTLRTYLVHNCNSESAAATLGIHRRTLGYRLDRAEEALGRSLADPALRAELWIALRLRDIG
ncbi:PucR family transcriptional regulator [Amycolatopsis taiwanensis]|uniref:PucR family transcriptional regulator n=1 Tax=Amycolatopsis taiwanensis TaxID=342230 RepID=A0A9W6R5T5_9PSEU|nr:PucR family transcriptional regulator [Amycolatopsis taiwanensis]GLY69629.1 PucR family transcriptional regulator [Amycolatopsis taiwanensis]